MNVNGRLTLGENIGDLGGLSVALQAYRISLKGQPAPVLDGVTGEQRFFLAWAQGWRNIMRDERLRTQVMSDPHSPPQFRVNGVVRNMDAWYTAFDIQPGDKLPSAAGTARSHLVDDWSRGRFDREGQRERAAGAEKAPASGAGDASVAGRLGARGPQPPGG